MIKNAPLKRKQEMTPLPIDIIAAHRIRSDVILFCVLIAFVMLNLFIYYLLNYEN